MNDAETNADNTTIVQTVVGMSNNARTPSAEHRDKAECRITGKFHCMQWLDNSYWGCSNCSEGPPVERQRIIPELPKVAGYLNKSDAEMTKDEVSDLCNWRGTKWNDYGPYISMIHIESGKGFRCGDCRKRQPEGAWITFLKPLGYGRGVCVPCRTGLKRPSLLSKLIKVLAGKH